MVRGLRKLRKENENKVKRFMTIIQDDFDNPWKTFISKYFKDFMIFFFPEIAGNIDWNQEVIFLDKEFQQIALNAEIGRRTADKLVQVYTLDGEETWVLIHVEVQSQYDVEFAKRIYVYNYRIFDLYDRRVASLAILADDRPNWKPDHFSYELLGCKAGIWYPTVKLLDYKNKWDELENDVNPFSTVVMAHLKTLETQKNASKRFDSKLALIKRLYRVGYGRNEIIDLFAFIDWIMRLPKELEKSLWQEVQEIEEVRKMAYVTSVQRIGREEGREEGREGFQRLLSKLFSRKFQLEPESLIGLFEDLSMEQMEKLGARIFEAGNIEDVKVWISDIQRD